MDSRYVPARSPGRIRIGGRHIAAEWSIDTDDGYAVLTSHDELVTEKLRHAETFPISFYRGSVMVAHGTGYVFRENGYAGRWSTSLKMIRLDVVIHD